MDANPLPSTSPARDKRSELTKLMKRAAAQLGTLGGGNHFVEVCLDESDQVWVVLHSGSRGVGNKLAQNHIRAAKAACVSDKRKLEDKNLAYFLDTDEGFDPYIADMLWAQGYAEANRQMMMMLAVEAVIGGTRLWPVTVLEKIDCHHNYAVRETHVNNEGVLKEMWITRKGAIRAEEGDMGIIPGSMGSSTYIVRGLGSSLSYNSAAHGAGRVMSRTQAKKMVSVEELELAMEGRVWQKGNAKSLLDESPYAYRNIEDVMVSLEGLVDEVAQLKCLVNYKGV